MCIYFIAIWFSEIKAANLIHYLSLVKASNGGQMWLGRLPAGKPHASLSIARLTTTTTTIIAANDSHISLAFTSCPTSSFFF